MEVWQEAEYCKNILFGNNSNDVKELIVRLAKAKGMFSIWWTVFDGNLDMRQRLRVAFLGTDPGCFDHNENLINRVGGNI